MQLYNWSVETPTGNMMLPNPKTYKAGSIILIDKLKKNETIEQENTNLRKRRRDISFVRRMTIKATNGLINLSSAIPCLKNQNKKIINNYNLVINSF